MQLEAIQEEAGRLGLVVIPSPEGNATVEEIPEKSQKSVGVSSQEK